IGNVDPKFGISKDQLAQSAGQAADVWNKAAGRTVLAYDPNSTFKINMIYDSRQQQSDAAAQLDQNYQNLKATDTDLTGRYNSLSTAYKQKVDNYNKDLSNYKKDLDKYNSEVDRWNSYGGAPEEEYNKLKKEKSQLDDEYKNLDKERQAINKLASQTNGVATQENQAVKSYNSSVETYTSQYGGTQEFEKGVFDGKEINIYEYRAPADLELTLTHELGHYLGMEHVQNSKSIMYYLLGDQNMNNIQPTAEDLAELDKVCAFN
ncbi:MAG: M57 family metalloprotease, partial [Candidatus Pacebacteria bacterium]|nr:M57 family metalloprotease [Candidatus Paceibacterota bacterium]